MAGLSYEVVAIYGPTAAGKSAVARLVADRLGTEVVSADALQVYRGLEILTNQPSEPTRLVGFRDVDETMSVGEYAALAHAAIDELVAAHGSAVVAGGTGLYLRAAVAELGIPPAVPGAARRRWENAYDRDRHAAHDRLMAMDPDAARTIHVNDRRRVVRALELAQAGASLAPAESALWLEETRRRTILVGLEVSDEELGRRIVARTDEMLARGVQDEVDEALRRGVSRTARHALGLEELASLPLDEARAQIARRTRRYARYQRKWLRRIPGLVRVDGERPPDRVADAILDLVRAR
jgi:tRNA dimethylallyltransferase